MSVHFSSHKTVITHFWSDFKTSLVANNGRCRWDDDSGSSEKYIIWYYDGNDAHVCSIWKGLVDTPQAVPYGVVSGGYSQAQNDTDRTDFEGNYKSASNVADEKRSLDGRPMHVNTITKYTTNFQLRPFSFQTANPSSLHNSSPTAAMSDLAMKCYDGSGTDVTSSPSTAVKTVIDFEPSYAFEVIGGWLDIPDATRTQAVTDGPGNWFASAIGVPDVPSYAGGSIPFVYEVDIALIPSGEGRILSDAVATSYLKPTIIGGTNYHTNKLRWIMKHPTGSQQWFQVFVRTYV